MTPVLPVSGESLFTDVTADSGMDFVHDSGKQGQLWTLEITGAGVGLLDFNADGLLDIWAVQGGSPGESGDGPVDRLYLNRGNLQFSDVTAQSGVSASAYGMGIAVGDIDGDGDDDVFLANYGPNQLFENLGAGRFRDVTADWGLTGSRWSISASFADVNSDGKLDLYVANYLDFDLETYEPCRRWSSRPSYCAPSNFEPVSDRLYLNMGTSFRDVSQSAGILAVKGAGMAVAADDYDADGDIDIYVANDGTDNFLWVNDGQGRFEDEGLVSGLGVNGDGVAEASMGIAGADFDQDGDSDLLVTHDVKESNTLYRNMGVWFEDQSGQSGLAGPSLPFSAFGVGWLDADNDGDLDLVAANGAVTIIDVQAEQGISPALRQMNQLFVNTGQGRFRAQPLTDGSEDVSRGLALGDLDNDGDQDVVIANNHDRLRLYRNESTANWLGISLRGPPDARHGIGTVLWRGESTDVPITGERRHKHSDGSYAAARDSRVLFGLGSSDSPQYIRVRWRDASEELFGPLSTGRYHLLVYGTGHRPGIGND